MSDDACPTCHRPYSQQERHAVRNTDPSTSRAAVINRAMRWDSMSMMALRILYENMTRPLSHWDIQCLAENRWGQGCLGKSPWKRSGELATDFDPPLMSVATDERGNPITVGGEFGDPVEAYRITVDGMAWYLRGAAKANAPA